MEILFYIIIFIMGTVLGKISVKAIHCIPMRKNMTTEKSTCQKCKHELNTIDSIPIISYLLTRGKCRYCNKKIEKTEFITELLLGIVAVGIFFSYSTSYLSISLLAIVQYICSMIFITTLVIIAGIDKTKKKIKKSVILFGTIIGLANILYLYIIKETTLVNIYKFIVYLLIIYILSIITNKHRFYQYSYLLEVMIICIYINMFIAPEVFLITAVLTMISLTLSVIIRKQKIKIDNSDILAEKEVNLDIPIAFYLCISTIIAMLIQGIQIIQI